MVDTYPLDPDQLASLFVDRGSTEALKELGGVDEIANSLKVQLNRGVSKDSIEYRIHRYGTNEYPERQHDSLLRLFFNAFKDVTIIVLCIAAVISLVLGVTFPNVEEGQTRATGWIEGASILIAVFLVTTVNAVNDYSKDKQFRMLEKAKENDFVFVIRDGEETQVRVFDLVVGDIVLLQRGDKVPADGIMIQSADQLRMDESNLTGESEAVKKDPERDPFLLSGSIVSEGDTRMLVLAVGTRSQWGKIILDLSSEDDPTPLQEHLDNLAAKIGWVGLACAILVFIVLGIWWGVQRWVTHEVPFDWAELEDFVQFFIIAVTIVVVAVPEGLPLAVTLSLAYSMQKMMKDNNLVRHLKACETMGGVTTICTDKTGTLTENRMTVVKGWIAGSSNITQIKNAEVRKLVSEGISINSKAYIKQNGLVMEYLGNKTECALLMLCTKWGIDFKQIREQSAVIKQFAFSSERKLMSTVISQTVPVLHCKGAPEVLLDRCNHQLDGSGNVIAISDETRSHILQVINSMSQGGLRTIALGFKVMEGEEDIVNKDLDEIESDIILTAIFGIQDPLRQEVPGAVSECKRAGIVVRMVTGDNIDTAKRIATECGILEPGYIAMEGKEFRKLPDDAYNVLSKLRVLARSTPQDKKLLVDRLKSAGEVVSVTGDGTNDAPALADAHVGLSMGIEGTGVAKQASDIIILDDNFNSIVKSVMWGRNVRENIQKFLQFQLTVNVVALVIAFVAAVSGQGVPLKAIQLLWVNLIMDTLAALALGTEAPTVDLLNRKPVGRNVPLITALMWKNIITQAAYQLIILFVALYHGYEFLGVEQGSKEHYTIVFNAFVFCQLFNEINSRKVVQGEWNVFKGLHKNLVFCGIVLAEAALQVVIVEFGGDPMKTVPLKWEQWGYCIAAGAGCLVWGFLVRLTPSPAFWCCKVKKFDLESGGFSMGETSPLLETK